MKVVIKVGSSTLTHDSGKFNLRYIDKLVRVISDIKSMGNHVILVSSGAQVAGMARLHLKEKPSELKKKQALAAVGQCELMSIYDKFFSDYGYNVGQILLNKEVMDVPQMSENVKNTFNALLDYDCIPIVNENDSVEVEEIKIGDNDTLSAVVSRLINADKLIILTDVDALYDDNPAENEMARPIRTVEVIDDYIRGLAGDTNSNKGTGGMITKIHAAEIATAAGTDMYITSGSNPEVIYDIIQGKRIGTLFKAQKAGN